LYTVEEVVSQACWFPASIDFAKHQIQFIHTSHNTLDNSAFHDGRTPIELDSQTVAVDIDEALQWHECGATRHTPMRIIAHTSFCGSTLLARLLSSDSKNFSYREPQILVELSNLRNARQGPGLFHSRWAAIVAFVFAQFSLHWPQHHAAIVKPSNWANSLLADLHGHADLHMVQISSDITSYLCANLRGGKPRISYSLNLLNHLCEGRPLFRQALTDIENMQLPGISNILHLLALCLCIQEYEFQKNRAQNDRVLELNKNDLMVNPQRAVDLSVKALDIAKPYNTREDLHRAISVNAKTDERAAFSPTQESLQDSWIKREYSAELETACAWFAQRKESTSLHFDAATGGISA